MFVIHQCLLFTKNIFSGRVLSNCTQYFILFYFKDVKQGCTAEGSDPLSTVIRLQECPPRGLDKGHGTGPHQPCTTNTNRALRLRHSSYLDFFRRSASHLVCHYKHSSKPRNQMYFQSHLFSYTNCKTPFTKDDRYTGDLHGLMYIREVFINFPAFFSQTVKSF